MTILEKAKRLAEAIAAKTQTSYQKRIENEIENFQQCENVHELPEIFHYWSNKYLVPMMQPFGFTNPGDFFLMFLERSIKKNPASISKIVSIGSGNCELEIGLAEKLIALGYGNFEIDCLDINKSMHERGKLLAIQKQVQDHINFVTADFNHWQPNANSYTAVMANQSLHHVLELAKLFGAVERGLKADGSFLISDMIGRNGHQRWPEALELVNQFWAELPDSHKFNHQMSRLEADFINHDCSISGFEGIRAQDILPLLVENFHFEIFLPFGNIIFPFIDRGFGHNFDAENEWDRDFIDRVHFADEEGMLSGQIKPTSMHAVVGKEQVQTIVRDQRLLPESCIRWSNSD
ncbi:MAG: class I SAM-dependent methyltransferase [Xanthomonadales bacterium]|nr:class I SAM-dependent methyltransferase [Xanthomonadales bacterium]